MKPLITVKNFELTPSIVEFVDTKFKRIEKKVDKDTTIRVTLSTDKEGQKAEALLYVGGSLVKMEEVNEDLYVSIDKLIDKLNFQVNKLLEKANEKRNESIRFYRNHNIEEGDTEVDNQPIVKRKQFNMKPMMEQEAILQMEMLGHSFFFFLNGETNTMCLLYKRNDGNYGLIESSY